MPRLGSFAGSFVGPTIVIHERCEEARLNLGRLRGWHMLLVALKASQTHLRLLITTTAACTYY